MHLPSALVGTPNSSMALCRLRGDHRFQRGGSRVRPLPQRERPSGPRHPWHLVQLGALAIFDPWMAGQNRRAEIFLPNQHVGHCLWHHLFLGCADDLFRYCTYGGGSVWYGADPWPCAWCAGTQDVQEPGQRDRPAGDYWPVWRGCAPLYPRDRKQSGQWYAFLGREGQRLPQLCE